MEEILKQILDKLNNLDKKVNNLDKKVDNLGDRIDLHDHSNKDEFKHMSNKLDGITEVVAKTMEDITKLKDKVEKQDVEI